MRKLSLVGLLCLSFMFNSCLGSFSAFNNLKDWNQDISDSKFVNNLVFWGLNIIPVYGLFFLGDVILFNVIEFWSGDNPIAMNEGETQTQMIAYKGNNYKMTATKNKFVINVLDGDKKGNTLEMIYTPENKSWNTLKDGEMIKLSSFKDGFMMVYLPNGEAVKLAPNTDLNQNLVEINEAVHNYKFDQRTVVVGI